MNQKKNIISVSLDKIMRAGIDNNTGKYEGHQIVLVNKSSLIFMLTGVIIVFLFFFSEKLSFYNPMGISLIVFYLLPLFYNYLKKYLLAKIWLAVGTPIFVAGADIYVKTFWRSNLIPIDYYTPFLFIICCGLFPFVIFTYKERGYILVTLIVNLLVIVFLHPTLRLFGILPTAMLLQGEAYSNFQFAILAAFLTFSLLSFLANRNRYLQQRKIQKLLKNEQYLSEDLEEANYELQRARYHYKSLFELSNEAILVHPISKTEVGKFIDANKKAEDLLGYSHTQLLELSPYELDMRDEGEIEELLKKGEIKYFEADLKHKSGHIVNTEVSFSFLNPEKNLAVIMIRNITRRKLQDKVAALMINNTSNLLGRAYLNEVSSQLVELLDIDAVGVGTIESATSIRILAHAGFEITDENSVYELQNSPCLRVVSEGEFYVSESIQEEFPDDLFFQQEGIEAYWGRAFYDSDNNFSGHFFVLKKSPMIIEDWFENILNMCYLRIGNELAQITNQDKLRAEKHKAVEASKAKSIFLATMSHELRTPLNSILGFAKLLKKDVNNQSQIDFLNKIERSGGNLLLLISDILDLSKIETGKLELNPHVTNIRNELRGIYDLFTFQSAEKGLSYSIRMDDNLPEFVKIDAIRFRQILFNIISNAFKFTASGSVKIDVTSEYKEGTVDITITITDTGIGIAPESQERIFEPFEQNINPKQNTNMGTGLGLSITRKLLNLMHGSITLKSTPGEGSEFTLVIRQIPIVQMSEQVVNTNITKFETHENANQMAHSIKIKEQDDWNEIVKKVKKDSDLPKFLLFLDNIKDATIEAHSTNSVNKINILSSQIIKEANECELQACSDLGKYLQKKNNTFQFDIVFRILSFLNNFYK